MKFEICVDSVAGVRAAVRAGADRVELCADLFEGGITPSRGMIRQARAVTGIGLHVIVRPRGGDFVFDSDEAAVMLADIETARQDGAEGVVIGALTPEGAVDIAVTRELIAAAAPLAVTFHRAFDMTADPAEALEALIGLGVSRVLTSGQEATVLEGAPMIRTLMEQAGERIIVMPGGGITMRNAARIVAELNPVEMHFAALVEGPSPARVRRDHVFMGGELRKPEFARLQTSAELIAATMQAARR
jgi:copper homeostasis protein